MGQMTSAVCVDMESAAAFSILSLNRRFSSYWDSIAFSVVKPIVAEDPSQMQRERERETELA